MAESKRIELKLEKWDTHHDLTPHIWEENKNIVCSPTETTEYRGARCWCGAQMFVQLSGCQATKYVPDFCYVHRQPFALCQQGKLPGE